VLIAVGLGLIVAITAVTAYFVAQEFAYVAADRSKLSAMADGGDRPARRALAITSRLSFMLSGAQLGITVTALLAGYVAEPYLGRGLADLLGWAGLPRGVSVSVSVAVALLVATVVQMVLGELAPKNLAIARPEALARALAASTRVYLVVAGPLIRLFDSAANRLLRAVGIEPVEEITPGATADDLVRIIADARAGGHLDEPTAALLDRGLDFRALTAGQVMVPRVDVVTLHATDPAVRVVELLETGHTRFPVIGDSADDVVGVLGVPDVLAIPQAERATTLAGWMAVPPLQVPAGLSLPRTLERLRSAHRQMAWWTSTAASPASSLWKMSRRSWSARSGTRTTCPNPPRPGRRTGRGGCRLAGGSMRSPTPPVSPCPSPATTTRFPGWSCAGWGTFP
jgi:CBS domain containing-hemolysin-like protein